MRRHSLGYTARSEGFGEGARGGQASPFACPASPPRVQLACCDRREKRCRVRCDQVMGRSAVGDSCAASAAFPSSRPIFACSASASATFNSSCDSRAGTSTARRYKPLAAGRSDLDKFRSELQIDRFCDKSGANSDLSFAVKMRLNQKKWVIPFLSGPANTVYVKFCPLWDLNLRPPAYGRGILPLGHVSADVA